MTVHASISLLSDCNALSARNQSTVESCTARTVGTSSSHWPYEASKEGIDGSEMGIPLPFAGERIVNNQLKFNITKPPGTDQ